MQDKYAEAVKVLKPFMCAECDGYGNRNGSPIDPTPTMCDACQGTGFAYDGCTMRDLVKPVNAAMTGEYDPSDLSIGLYRIFWDDPVGGGTSLAAVGVDGAGNHWYMPTNWINTECCFDWSRVKSVERIEA